MCPNTIVTKSWDSTKKSWDGTKKWYRLLGNSGVLAFETLASKFGFGEIFISELKWWYRG